MAREERDQRRSAFRTKPSNGRGIGATKDDAVQAAAPLPDGAHRRLSHGQMAGLAILLATLLLLATFQTRATLEGFHLLFFVGFMSHSAIKLVAAFTPRAPTLAASLPDEALPAYTIIVPLYREAAVAAELVANLTRLDYPRDRLQLSLIHI